jgi:hypothetical protein
MRPSHIYLPRVVALALHQHRSSGREPRGKSAVQSQAAAKAVIVTASDGPQKAVAAASPGAGSIDLISEQEEIARLAYLYWEARGGQGGSAEDDWFRAEQDVLKRRTSAAN